ncbi:hypothetical protein ACF50P_005689, partial [Escherichia coli]
ASVVSGMTRFFHVVLPAKSEKRRRWYECFCNTHLCSQRSHQCRTAVVDDLYSSFFLFKSIGYEYKDAVRTF